MLLVKYFSEEVYKLRRFLTQIKIKITNKGPGLLMAIKQVAYTGLFLIGRVLEQFKPYFTEVQLNRLNTTNIKAWYMFLIQNGFTNQFKQIFKSLEEELIAKNKLKIYITNNINNGIFDRILNVGNMHQLKQRGTYNKILLRTEVKSLKYINTYKRRRQYNRPY